MSTPHAMFRSIPKSRVPRQHARLNLISNFPNSAVKLPTNIKSLDLVFKTDSKHGHMGAKKFFKNNLPTILFHNPELPIVVTRVNATNDEESLKCPAKLTIQLLNGNTEIIDMKHKFYNDIMAEFKDKTGAISIPLDEIPVFKK